MYLTTDRLTIRHFVFDDWATVHGYTSDPIVMKYMPEGVLSEEATQEWVLNNSNEKAKKFPVALKSSEEVIGHMVFHPYFGEHTYEIGWVFNANFQGRGYASEAAQAVLKYGFKTLDLHRIIATCQPENVASYRVMEKVGMRREGHFKKCIPHGAEWWDEYDYAILDEEWKN